MKAWKQAYWEDLVTLFMLFLTYIHHQQKEAAGMGMFCAASRTFLCTYT